MRIVKPHAEIFGDPTNLAQGIVMLERIEQIARLSHRSENRIETGSWERLLRTVVLEHGDLSVVEHEFIKVFVLCDRGITHEWVRHRVPWQYTQESTRFCNYGKLSGEIDVVEPMGLPDSKKQLWLSQMESAEKTYMTMLADPDKLSPQIARSVLPTCLATRIYCTANLRGWRHFFLMRTCAEAHPQMRELTIPLLKQFQERIPLLFEDITPNERQAQAMRRLR